MEIDIIDIVHNYCKEHDCKCGVSINDNYAILTMRVSYTNNLYIYNPGKPHELWSSQTIDISSITEKELTDILDDMLVKLNRNYYV